MVNSFKAAFEKARQELVTEPVKKKEWVPPTDGKLLRSSDVSISEAVAHGGVPTPDKPRRQREEAKQSVKVTYGRVSERSPRNEQGSRHAPQSGVGVPKPQLAAASTHMAAVPKPAPRTTHIVSVSETAAFALSLRTPKPTPLLPSFDRIGRATQCHSDRIDDKRQVVLGLDFGTSSVKVVIGDDGLEKAFAVPFCKARGINRFLLPSRLYQTEGVFSLGEGTHVHRDLKLSLLASPADSVLQQRVIAFLALVIRRARGWLFSEQAAAYKRTGIVWKLAVGLPAAQHLETPLSKLFERLSLAAWIVAGSSSDVSVAVIETALDKAHPGSTTVEDVEITVVPEIAAQIYGFVASSSFDKKAANIYLMADVGAGTVDSALFRVKPAKGGRWDFEFYTAVVEPNGVSNLHRDRVNWWTEELTKVHAPPHLLDDLAASKLIVDQQISAPASFREYFGGVQVKVEAGVKTPDELFFKEKVLAQVQGKTFWRTWKNNHLSKVQLTNVPFFMCGGGVLMEFYRALESGLASMSGYTWLKAERWVMATPMDLVGDGVAGDEYDRLSVAYGLSRLEIGKIVKALPPPIVDVPPVDTWRDNYIGKDLI